MSSDADSRPPSPPSRSDTPNLLNLNMGYFTLPFERFVREDSTELTSAFTLLDTLETYFDARIDLIQRNLTKQTDKLKLKAELAFNDLKAKSTSPDVLLAQNLDKELQKLRLKFATRMTSLATAWQSARVVRTRDKISFFFGVMSVLVSALLFGLAPEYVDPIHHPIFFVASYAEYLETQMATKNACGTTSSSTSVTTCSSSIFFYIWIFPQSEWMFVACYCLSHGAVASAVITWRNSLVFHDIDKVTSLFVHIYSPFAFTVIRHFYPNAEERFPALRQVPHLHPWKALLLSSLIYLVWQLMYWKASIHPWASDPHTLTSNPHLRTTSLSFMLNNKRGAISRALSSIPAKYRAESFMAGQFVYAVLTSILPIFVLYDSSFWSGAFLLLIFSVSVWNGGGFYIEVFGRKFELELETLRKELAEANLRSGRSSPTVVPEDMSTPVSPILQEKTLAPNSPPLLAQIDTIAAGEDISLEDKKQQ
ncbi:hypothetical protein EW146_g1039 [Bondarzewia mesenterica]|uniref:Glycerophosphocholine acyltransferase 1 n=1 Tax=Bondarzewia mesenterica TaxID=1095465 RepID=A0A4S4M7A8_9AGAM|nr:hypothetical protein EW146_g1039 [Bondarzewia mesenterica]